MKEDEGLVPEEGMEENEEQQREDEIPDIIGEKRLAERISRRIAFGESL